ncbi:MAG: hypothetical protein H0T48_07670 [Gemmatimonadaceae bacterium]|nr:hypothetical protein [Gemmatimonadaceae bacterium]
MPFPTAAGPPASELDAIILQMVVTLGVAVLCTWLFARYRKPVFGAWAATWTLYVFRLLAIYAFLLSGARASALLYWHQVVTGWTGIAVLATALVFSRRLRWRNAYALALLFPLVWSYIAIYHLDHFLLAALPAVLFLSGATLWTGLVFWSYARRTPSAGARVLAAAFVMWGIHHLDYPFLRAYGAWAPWGYYLDIVFTMSVAAGILLLVADELRGGVVALATLTADHATAPFAPRTALLDSLLARAVAIPAVRGAAVYGRDESGPVCERGAGICRDWSGSRPAPADAALLERATAGKGRAVLASGWQAPDGSGARDHDVRFAAVLPVQHADASGAGALVVVAEDHDPFAALDEEFLTALGRQVGSSLALSELNRALGERGEQLERLSARMVVQQEEERRRLSRELHDETAQLLSAVKMELAGVRASLPPAQAERVDDAVTLTDAAIRSIRSAIEGLRPPLLDDLGLVPALRSLVSAFRERAGCEVRLSLSCPADVPAPSREAELALFRVLQEALSNIARHACAATVWVTLDVAGDTFALTVEDDGRGITPSAASRNPGVGVIGMRERVAALGGSFELALREGSGTRLVARIPGRSQAVRTA